MSLVTRQKIGLGLILLSLLAAIAIQLATGELMQVTGADEATKTQELLGGWVSTEVTIFTVTFSHRYTLPLVACGLLGLLLLIPQRRTHPGA